MLWFQLKSNKFHLITSLCLFSQDDYEGICNVVAFFLAFLCCVFQVRITAVVCSRLNSCKSVSDTSLLLWSPPQCHLYLFHSPLKKMKSFALLSVIVLCNSYLLGMRNTWQLVFHVSVASFSTVLTLMRKLQDRVGDCGVWGHVCQENQGI